MYITYKAKCLEVLLRTLFVLEVKAVTFKPLLWARNENKVGICQRTIPQCQGLSFNVLFFSQMKIIHFNS